MFKDKAAIFAKKPAVKYWYAVIYRNILSRSLKQKDLLLVVDPETEMMREMMKEFKQNVTLPKRQVPVTIDADTLAIVSRSPYRCVTWIGIQTADWFPFRQAVETWQLREKPCWDLEWGSLIELTILISIAIVCRACQCHFPGIDWDIRKAYRRDEEEERSGSALAWLSIARYKKTRRDDLKIECW